VKACAFDLCEFDGMVWMYLVMRITDVCIFLDFQLKVKKPSWDSTSVFQIKKKVSSQNGKLLLL